jgi:type I restriction-modification system DNA methylase subunit
VPTAFDEAFSRVKELVDVFKANETYYLSPQFSEAQARMDFIDKFWMALGWDVNHDTQKNPYEQEVKVERNESGSQRRADYAFFLLPNFRDVQFFVEAKKPHGEFGSPDNYFQTLRYGWSGKTPLAVLTNFDELHILDSRFKPHIGDTLSRVVRRFSYADYADSEKFAGIYWLFSREALANGAPAKFAGTLPRPKSKTFRRELFKGGYQSLDEAFLIELDKYREMLALAFKSKNPDLNSEQLTEITQRTIDRLVFIRFLEDKQIESARHVEHFGAEGSSAWEDFVRVSLNLDRIYNGVVFKRHEILDAPGFQIDEKPFRIICDELSDPTSPYNFDSIPIHILGSIYERFLGKIITDGARVVEKPEVRKAGGVYYTPEYIVRYIVAHTVGQAVEGRTPAEIAGMHFADIACGSGSFLLEVFDSLLRHHTKFYNKNPGKVKKGDCVQRDDGLHLSLKKKQEILRNNVYGVDIDRQAVEVAQLSLYLKLLDDETIGSTAAFQNEFHFTLLPPLTDNIVCGNSLIGTDILDTGKFTPEEEKKLNPMDFERRFPLIFQRKSSGGELHDAVSVGDHDYTMPGVPLHGTFSYKKVKEPKAAPPPMPGTGYAGGFDAIVGNPPYGADFNKQCETYIRSKFRAVTNSLDSFIMFVEQAGNLLNPRGYFGMIIPSGWVSTPSSKKLRERFTEQFRPTSFVSLPYDVFEGAYIDTVIVTAERLSPTGRWSDLKDTNVDLVVFPIRHKVEGQNPFEPFRKIGNFVNWIESPDKEFLILSSKQEAALVKKLRQSPVSFDSVVEIMRGIETYHPSSARTCRKPKRAFNGEMLRYYLDLGPEAFESYPAEIQLQKPVKFFNGPRILLRQLLSRKFRLQAVYAEEEFLTNQSVQSLISRNSFPDIKCILAFLNSRVVSWFFCQINLVARRDDFPKTIIKQTRELPLPEINLKNPTDKMRHDKLVSLVEKMLEARKQLSAAQTDGDKDFYTHKCATLDHQIDALVYELYGLTEDEIKIVEAGSI